MVDCKNVIDSQLYTCVNIWCYRRCNRCLMFKSCYTCFMFQEVLQVFDVTSGVTRVWCYMRCYKCLMWHQVLQVFDVKEMLHMFNIQEVLQRHPLHTLAQVVQYSDGGAVNNIIFKIGNVNKLVFTAFVFQCANEVDMRVLEWF